MQLAQTARFTDPRSRPRRFGRGPARNHTVAQAAAIPAFSEDMKLFATTFAAGFLFVTCLIA